MIHTEVAGVGIDLVAVDRVTRLTSSSEDVFRLRVLGARERDEIASDGDAHERNSAYACSIAAKEAFLKALGSGLSRNDRWRDIEVVDRNSMKPRLVISGEPRQRLEALRAETVHFSVALVRDHAIATVVLERAA